MLRLKEYLDGGPDSRKEVTAGITLEALQARYEAAMARERLETDSMKGIVPVRIYDRDDDQAQARRPPARRFEDATKEVADDVDDELDDGDDAAEGAPDSKTAAMS
jgi:hypothetical protein